MTGGTKPVIDLFAGITVTGGGDFSHSRGCLLFRASHIDFTDRGSAFSNRFGDHVIDSGLDLIVAASTTAPGRHHHATAAGKPVDGVGIQCVIALGQTWRPGLLVTQLRNAGYA